MAKVGLKHFWGNAPSPPSVRRPLRACKAEHKLFKKFPETELVFVEVTSVEKRLFRFGFDGEGFDWRSDQRTTSVPF